MLYVQLPFTGLAVATGVVEEKTRWVEGVVQLVAYGVGGLGDALTTGLPTVTGTAVAVFAVLYAAGSLVSRQEEVSSVTAPLTVLVIVMFVLAQTSVQDPDGTVSSVMPWVPPLSAILMPLRTAAGVTGPGQVVGTAARMVVVTAGLAVGSAAVHERSVLRSGSKVGGTQALGRG